MRNFDIGDIVKRKDGGQSFIFMVTDFTDFSVVKGSKKVVDIDYEITQIFPVSILINQSIVSQNDIVLHAKDNSKDKEFIIEFIAKERQTRGLFERPYYEIMAEENKASHLKAELESEKNLDIVRYDLLETIDECLDAMNDLEELHKVFGDESYLELKDLVKDKLKEMIE